MAAAPYCDECTVNVAELITILAPLDPSTQVHIGGAHHIEWINKRGVWKSKWSINGFDPENNAPCVVLEGGRMWHAPEPTSVRLTGHWPKPKALRARVDAIEAEMAMSALARRLTVTRGWRR